MNYSSSILLKSLGSRRHPSSSSDFVVVPPPAGLKILIEDIADNSTNEVIGESLELPFLKGTLGCWRRTRTYLDEVRPYHRSRLDASELLLSLLHF